MSKTRKDNPVLRKANAQRDGGRRYRTRPSDESATKVRNALREEVKSWRAT